MRIRGNNNLILLTQNTPKLPICTALDAPPRDKPIPGGTAFTVLASLNVNGNPDARTYSVNPTDAELKLAMAANTYTVRAQQFGLDAQ